MLTAEDLQAISDLMDKKLAPIKEDTEITRDTVNSVVEWIDFYFRDERPFPVDEDEAV